MPSAIVFTTARLRLGPGRSTQVAVNILQVSRARGFAPYDRVPRWESLKGKLLELTWLTQNLCGREAPVLCSSPSRSFVNFTEQTKHTPNQDITDSELSPLLLLCCPWRVTGGRGHVGTVQGSSGRVRGTHLRGLRSLPGRDRSPLSSSDGDELEGIVLPARARSAGAAEESGGSLQTRPLAFRRQRQNLWDWAAEGRA